MKKGIINGIWLTKNNGRLHPNIVPNMGSWVNDAKAADFEVVLWTNPLELSPQDIKSLQDAKIIVKDYRESRQSSFYKYFLHFFILGLQGDVAAFALASDILRMSILELMPDNKIFIYVDPNDVQLINLKEHLLGLENMLARPKFGFAFPINQISDGAFELRNDVLIAKKSINPNFFRDYLKFYAQHLEKNYKSYARPRSNQEAQNFALNISNQTANEFFDILLTKPLPTLRVKFAVKYSTMFPLANSNAFLDCACVFEHSNTWMPTKWSKEDGQREFKELAASLFDKKFHSDKADLFSLKEIQEKIEKLSKELKEPNKAGVLSEGDLSTAVQETLRMTKFLVDDSMLESPSGAASKVTVAEESSKLTPSAKPLIFNTNPLGEKSLVDAEHEEKAINTKLNVKKSLKHGE